MGGQRVGNDIILTERHLASARAGPRGQKAAIIAAMLRPTPPAPGSPFMWRCSCLAVPACSPRGLPLSAEALVFGRTAIAAFAVVVAALATGGGAFSRPEFAGRALAGGALVEFFVAIQVSSVAIGLMGYASYPLFAALLAALGGERPKRADWGAPLP